MTTDRIETTDIASQISKDISLYREKRQKKKYRTSDSFTKKETLIEIGVFLLITFGLMLTFGWKSYSESGEKNVMTGLDMLFYYLTTFSPAIGCIATRYMFCEGFRDDILFPKFAGHFKGYLLSVLLPILFGILNCIFITIVLGAGFTVKAEGGVLEAVAAFSLYSMTTYTAAFILIGEELGWRAFLYDKIERLIGLHGSIIIGGIIWGLWHIPPLITIGLNFGKDAPGFPVTNTCLMCVFCIFGGAMLQMLRKMTDSVIAPIIAH
jgi:membrane protease YdiL (CAAX protease family)